MDMGPSVGIFSVINALHTSNSALPWCLHLPTPCWTPRWIKQRRCFPGASATPPQHYQMILETAFVRLARSDRGANALRARVKILSEEVRRVWFACVWYREVPCWGSTADAGLCKGVTSIAQFANCCPVGTVVIQYTRHVRNPFSVQVNLTRPLTFQVKNAGKSGVEWIHSKFR